MNTRKTPLGDDEYRKLIEHADERSAKHGFTVFLIAHSGLTRSEAAHFRPDWFNSSIPAIAVPPEQDGWTPRSRHRVRRIPLSNTAAEQLNQYINVLSEDSFEVTPKAIYDRIRTAARDTGIENVSPRQLRHTFARRLSPLNLHRAIFLHIIGKAIPRTVPIRRRNIDIEAFLDIEDIPPLYENPNSDNS